MAKRFTDTLIWEDEWYQSLSIEDKLLWRFLVDRCDAVGFWKKNLGLASYLCSFPITNDRIKGLNKGKNRLVDYGEYIEILDFVKFQYGELRESCNPHKKFIAMLESYRNKGYLKSKNRLQEQEEDKEEENLRGIVKGETPKELAFKFFSEPSQQESVARKLCDEGMEKKIAWQEVGKFVSYWTEKNKSGTKQRWELQKTFEVQRRLATWFGNIKTYGEKKVETRGISIIS